jgi:glyoxylase-like metal-dependent hydrolase (beta-lactamase superfamily II)
MQEIAPGIYVESNYPPYNLALITTDRGPIVVDIPPRPSHAWAWQHQVEEIAGTPRYAVITDASPERQVAAALWDVPIIASAATLRTIATYDERSWRDVIQSFVALYPAEAGELVAVKPHRPTLAFGDRFLLYERTPPIEFEAVAGAATGSLWLTIPEHNLLFAGDTVVVNEPAPLIYTPDSKAWLNMLGTLARHSTIRRIVPGRGKTIIYRQEIEPLREFLRVMRRTARTLAHRSQNGLRLSQSAQDLGQVFFNSQGQDAVRRIKAGLERLIEEILEAQVPPPDVEGE